MPCLLLDVDGVLVRDKKLLDHVKHNAAQFVQKKLPRCKNPVETNKSLYLEHGHTARGLKQVYGIDASDYNKIVYDKSLMAHLADVMDSKQFQMDARIIHGLTTRGWEITLFSNSPYEWVMPVGRAINDRIKIRCPGPDATDASLKPDEIFYKEFDSCGTYYFVDDSVKNIEVVRTWPNWRAIHFCEEKKNDYFWCPQVRSLPEMSLLLGNYWRESFEIL
jgi:hypothetical protein